MDKFANCSCGKKLNIDNNKSFPIQDNCPVCSGSIEMRARDFWGISYCKNAHVFHTCLTCKEIVIGDSPKFIYQDTQKSNKTAGEKILADIELRRSEIEKMVDDFLDPDDGFTVMGDFKDLINKLIGKRLSERESLLVIQSFHAAIDLVLKHERKGK